VTGATIGWFGKLPSHGDFLRRRVPDRLLGAWDAWLQRCMAHSRERLGAHWLDAYLTSPLWRFHLSAGVAGDASYAGVLLPSVDRVGRYFPLSVFVELPAALPPMAIAIQGRAWFREIEALVLGVLEEGEHDVEAFDAAVAASARALASVATHHAAELGVEFPRAARHWRLPVSSTDRMPAALIDPLVAQLSRQLAPLTLWWTDGSEQVGASCLVAQSLPDPERFVAMLDGRWSDAGWSGDFTDAPEEEAAPELRYRLVSASVSDTGPMRDINQDRVLEDPQAAVWVVADGMGGHHRGEHASQLIVDVLNSLGRAATLASELASLEEGLARANHDLARAALQRERERSGSTVVALAIRQGEWGVLWAGDSRTYLLRDGVCSALTRDHAVDIEHMAFDPAAAPKSTGAITRAVGGHDTLELDRATGRVALGDRFLLCSDGVHGALAHDEIARILSEGGSPKETVAALLHRALLAGSTDNISAIVVDVLPED
jgi:type VI secretion system protein ImpM